MGYGLIGKTLGHSFSKVVHEALTDYSYSLYPLPTEEAFHGFMKKRDFPGINVTIPYKQDVIPYCTELDAKAKAIGAINTIVNREGKLYGYNTDYDGFLYLAQQTGISFTGKTVLILGTGGTFKTVSAVLEDAKAKEIFVATRRPEEKAEHPYQTLSYEEAKTKTQVEIVINTSPVGMYPDNENTPLPLDGLPNLQGVLDVVYNPLSTCLIQEAKAKNIPASGGLPMLVAQAKFAAEHFQGKEIPKSAMDKVVGDIASLQSNLVLIGMPGCGKTTLAREIACSMKRTFVDLDAEIEKEVGTTIPILFATQGEEAFRTLETEICRRFAKEHSLVISTGGGIVKRPENIQALQQNGVLIYVDRPLKDLQIGTGRPLSKSPEQIATLFEERSTLYETACHSAVANTLPVPQVAKKIQEAYDEIFNSQWTKP